MTQGNVLLVEDNAALIENLTEILEARGYSVRSSSTVQAAMKAAHQWVDVALVDFKLPEGDGTELAARLKTEVLGCEVILLTGFASIESAAAAVRAGVYAYLIKPCATEEMLRTVGHALKQVQSHAEKRELARRAQAAERLASVGTLTAGLSHEIRNPLNAASLQLEVLERRLKKLDSALQTPLLEPLTLVRDEIRRLDHVLQDFLEFARPSRVNPRALTVSALLKKVTDLLRTDADHRGLSLELDCPSELVALGDEGQLAQVFMNLCLNALDASPPNGKIHVRAEAGPHEVLVHVDDEGSGIALDARERIFEPFFTTKPTGSGLGLPITNAIITQHGGSITVAQSPERGARFTVKLPAP